jgi:hypothetical protein
VRTDFFDEVSDTIFAIAMAAAIGFGAANIGLQVSKQWAASGAAAASQTLRVQPPRPRNAEIMAPEATPPAF